MAVIYRAHFHSLEVQMELTSRGIPFQIASGLRFFEQAHVKDVAAFMKFAVESPRRSQLHAPGAAAARRWCTASAAKLWSEWLRCEGSRRWPHGHQRSSHYLLAHEDAQRRRSKPGEQFAYTLDELIDAKGIARRTTRDDDHSVVEGVYADYMKAKFNNFDQRNDDLERLSDYSGALHRRRRSSSAQLALLSGVDTDRYARPRSAGPTMRSRSPPAIKPRASNGRSSSPSGWPMACSRNRRVLDEGSAESGVEEERRLFYVTVTRAKDELYLIYPLIYHQARDGDILQKPSRFIEDVPAELMDPWNVRSVFLNHALPPHRLFEIAVLVRRV